jgi:hypothetical protein
MAHDVQTVRSVLQESRRQLWSRAHVVATGVGYKVTQGRKTNALAIVCSVTEKVSPQELPQRDRVPSTLDGVPTDVVATGVIRAFQSRTARLRPALGGVSIGHPVQQPRAGEQ